MKQIVLVDSKNQLYRSHFAPSLMPLSREDGFPTGAIYGCLNYVLLGVHKHLPDASFIWCWDGQGETWRHKLTASTPQLKVEPQDDETDYQANMINDTLSYFGIKKDKAKKVRPKVYGYKANRAYNPKKFKTKYPTDEKARALIQIPVLKLILDGIGIRQFEIKELECDDLIGILVKKIIKLDKECEVYIFSGDRDFYQLLKYPQVSIIKSTKGGKLEIPKIEDIENEFQISIKDWTKYRAWTGDSTDNIEHLFKVGKVTARKMLAAGLDPSESDVMKVLSAGWEDELVKFERYFQPHGIEKLWPAIHNNYKLCEIVRSENSELLSEDVKERLHKAFKGIEDISDFKRDTKKNTADMYRKITVLLSQYELNSILAQRDILWQIP